MKREDDQKLWDLLGQAAQPQVSPFFARNVIRRIREEANRFDYLRAWFSPRRLVPASVVAIALVALMLAIHHPTPQMPAESAPDAVLASDETNLWDENQTL